MGVAWWRPVLCVPGAKKEFPQKIKKKLFWGFNTLRGTDILVEKMLDPHHWRRDGGGLKIKSRLSFLLQRMLSSGGRS
jgi:hypothetical protein